MLEVIPHIFMCTAAVCVCMCVWEEVRSAALLRGISSRVLHGSPGNCREAQEPSPLWPWWMIACWGAPSIRAPRDFCLWAGVFIEGAAAVEKILCQTWRESVLNEAGIIVQALFCNAACQSTRTEVLQKTHSHPETCILVCYTCRHSPVLCCNTLCFQPAKSNLSIWRIFLSWALKPWQQGCEAEWDAATKLISRRYT